MKRKIQLQTAIAFFLVAILTLISSSNLCAQDKNIVGLCLDDLFAERWYVDRDNFKLEAEKLGLEVIVSEANNDPKAQFQQAKDMIEKGAKVLVVVPANADSSCHLVKYAHEHNVKVISYDRLIKNCKLDYFVSFDGEKVGEIQAEYCLSEKPKGRYVIIEGPTRDYNALWFAKGHMNILQAEIDKGNIEVLFNDHAKDWVQMLSYSILDSIDGAAGQPFDVVLAATDKFAMGAAMWFDANGVSYDNVVITGQDASKAGVSLLVEDKLNMTIYKPFHQLATMAANLANDIINSPEKIKATHEIDNNKILVPSLLIDPVLVTKDNIEATLIKTGHMSHKEIYGE